MDRRLFLQRSAWVAVAGLWLPHAGLVLGDEAVEAFARLTPQPARVFTGMATYSANGWFRHEFFPSKRGGYEATAFFVMGENVARPFGHGWQRVLSTAKAKAGKYTMPAPYLPPPHSFRDPRRLVV